MEQVKYDQLVTAVSGLGECDLEDLLALWALSAPDEPVPPTHPELLRALQVRIANSPGSISPPVEDLGSSASA